VIARPAKYIELRCGSESLQSGLIGGTIVSRYSFFKAFEFRHHDALVHARFTGLDLGGPY
jgi:hypothetical protein